MDALHLQANSAKPPLSQGYGTCRKFPFMMVPAIFGLGVKMSMWLWSITFLLTSSGFWAPCWNSMVSTDLGLRHETTSCIHLVTAVPLQFCPPRSGEPPRAAELTAQSLLYFPGLFPSVVQWWSSAEIFQNYKTLPGVDHQLPLNWRPQPFCLSTWCIPLFLQGGSTEPLSSHQAASVFP